MPAWGNPSSPFSPGVGASPTFTGNVTITGTQYNMASGGSVNTADGGGVGFASAGTAQLLGSSSNQFSLQTNADNVGLNLVGRITDNTTRGVVRVTNSVLSGTALSATSGTQRGFVSEWTVNQGGTAAFVASDQQITLTATGSGGCLIQRSQVGGATKWSIDSNGSIGAWGVTPPTTRHDYTITNLTEQRSLDCNGGDIDVLSDVVGQLITDLIAYGLFQ